MAASVLLSARRHIRRQHGGHPNLPHDRWPSSTSSDWKANTQDMDSRYYRSSSPGSRRLAVPERSSTGTVGSYDPRYYSARSTPRDSYSTPRSSDVGLYPPSSSSSGRSAHELYSGRPRRQTFGENDPRRTYGVSPARSGRPAVIHSSDRPTSPVSRGYDRGGYVTPATSARRETKKVYGIDDNKKVTRLPDDREPKHRRQESLERGGHRTSGASGKYRGYHVNGPLVRTKDIDDEHGYSYTDAAGMYRDTEPRWRQRRGSLDRSSRRDRPSSMIESAPTRAATRDSGPPPSTRGFDRINNDMTRSESLREPRYRPQSVENSLEYPTYRDDDQYIPTSPRPSAARVAPTVHQPKAELERGRERERERDWESGRDWEQERLPIREKPDGRYAARNYDETREPRKPKRNFEDREVGTRGFGIRTGSVDRYASSREESLDRRGVPAHPIEPAIQEQKLRSYAPEPPRDVPREYDPRERDRVLEKERDRDRDSDREERERERERVKRREQERVYDKPYDRDREHRRREPERDSDSDRERTRRRHERGRDSDSDPDLDHERSRRERKDHPARSSTLTDVAPAAALAAGAAVAGSTRDRHYEEGDAQRRRAAKPEPVESGYGHERHYVDDRSRAAPPPPPPAYDVDPDEDYRRRLQQELERTRREQKVVSRDSSGSDRERRSDRDRRHRRDADESRLVSPPRNHHRHGSNTVLEDKELMNEPGELSDQEGSRAAKLERSTNASVLSADAGAVALIPKGENRVRIVEPGKGGEKEPPRGILRKPTAKFPEDPNPIREGVAPLKDATKKGIPPGARWTKIDRRLVNPEALEAAQERFEERLDCVIVLRVLTKEEIQKFANKTKEIREERYQREHGRHRGDRDRDRGGDPRSSHDSHHDHEHDHDRGHHSDRETEQDRDYRDGHGRRRSSRRGYDGHSESTDDSYSDYERERERLRGPVKAIEGVPSAGGVA